MAEHLTSRHFQTERYRSVFIDEPSRSVTFFIWNLMGQAIGYQKYQPDQDKLRHNDPKLSRYYTYLSPELPKTMVGVWGLESFNYRDDVLCLTEGVFDACRLHNLGVPAIATFTSNPKPIRNWLSLIPRRIVAVRDNDDASKLQNFADKSFQTTSKDLGDAIEEEVKEIVERILRK